MRIDGGGLAEAGVDKEMVVVAAAPVGEGEFDPTCTCEFVLHAATAPDASLPFYSSSSPAAGPGVVSLPSYAQSLAVPGLALCLANLLPGERARFTLPPALAFGDAGLPPHVPPKSALVLDIQLVARAAATTTADPSQLLEEAKALEQAKDFAAAARAYQACLLSMALAGTTTPADVAPVKLGAARCYLALEDFTKTVSLSTQVLASVGGGGDESMAAEARLLRCTANVAMLHSLNEAQSDLAWLKQHSSSSSSSSPLLLPPLQSKLDQAMQRTRSSASSNSYTSYSAPPPFRKLDEHTHTKRVFLSVRVPTSASPAAPAPAAAVGAVPFSYSAAVARGKLQPAGELGRIELELFADTHPKTCAAFVQAVVNENDEGGYKHTSFHRVHPGFAILAGAGLPLRYQEENIALCQAHNQPFLLGVSSTSVSSHFYITTSNTALPQLDGRFVVFGRVVHGQEVCRLIEQVPTYEEGENGEPKQPVVIEDCGLVVVNDDDASVVVGGGSDEVVMAAAVDDDDDNGSGGVHTV